MSILVSPNSIDLLQAIGGALIRGGALNWQNTVIHYHLGITKKLGWEGAGGFHMWLRDGTPCKNQQGGQHLTKNK